MRIDQMARLARQIFLLLVMFVIARGVIPAHGQDRHLVSLELVLLVDVSASVNEAEFRLQTGGLAAAFRSAAVLDAIRGLASGGMAICVVQWADHAHQQISVDWTLLRRETDALRLAERIAGMPRRIHGGHTALGDALAFALSEINSNGYSGLRRVIDLSGDGRANDGRSLSRVREDVLGNGITINGLAILNELPLLEGYFREQLIGGDGAFVITATDYSDFARAMSHKLEREIRSKPVARNMLPDAVIETGASMVPQTRLNSFH